MTNVMKIKILEIIYVIAAVVMIFWIVQVIYETLSVNCKCKS